MINKFVARYEENGVKKSIYFDKNTFDEAKATELLKKEGIKNFFFFFEPAEPIELDENTMMFSGEVGYEITTGTLLPHLKANKTIVLDSFGGYLDEGWKIHDLIKNYYPETEIGIMGACYSSTVQILLAAKQANRWATENSTGLIHAPWTYEVGDDEVLRKTAESLGKEKNKIANFYQSVSGKSLEEILQVMKDEKILTSSEMKDFNFISEIRNGTNNKPIDMKEDKNKETEKEKQLSGIEKTLNAVMNFINPVKNEVITDVDGNELDFGDGTGIVGETATVDGANAEGEYVMPNGDKYVFEGGELIEIISSDEDVEDLETENETLKAENESLKTENESLAAQIENSKAENLKFRNEAKSQIESLSTEFANFKSQFSTEEVKDKVTPETKNENAPKHTYKRKVKE